MDSLGHNINEEKPLLNIELINKEEIDIGDSILRNTRTVMSDKSVAIDDSLMRSLDEDPNDTISVIMTTPDTLEVNMYPKGEKGYSPRVDLTKKNGVSTLTIYDERGSHTTQILDGDGSGLDVQVNGTSVVNDGIADIRIKTINNQSLIGTGNITIQGGEGTRDYDVLQNKPKINGNTLMGSISGDDLGLQSKITSSNKLDYGLLKNNPEIPTNISDLENDVGYITKSVNNLENYTKSSLLANVATSGDYDDLSDKPTIPTVVNNVSSIDENNALSAYQGKLLNDRINNVESRGRFLALWNAVTGKPTTEPQTLPYDYKTGDWFRVSAVGDINYMPEGSSYTGAASTTRYIDDISVSDCFWYDGTTWQLEVNHAAEVGVQDVKVNGTSIVTLHTANLLTESPYSSSNKIATKNDLPTATSELTNDSGFVTSSYHDNTKQDALISGTNIKTIGGQSLLGSGNIETGGKGDNITTRLNNQNETEVIGIYTTQNDNRKIWEGTRAEYNAITIKDDNTYYYIVDETLSYNDLSDRPTIPTKTSELINDNNFASDANYVHTDSNYTTNEKNKLEGLENYDDTQINNEINGIKNDLITNYSDTNETNNIIDYKVSEARDSFINVGNTNEFKNTGLWFPEELGFEFWSGVLSRGSYGSGIKDGYPIILGNGACSQSASVLNGKHTIAFNYSQLTSATASVKINGITYNLESGQNKRFEKTINVSDESIILELIGTGQGCYQIYNLMVNLGEYPALYEMNKNEMHTGTIDISKGITVFGDDINVNIKNGIVAGNTTIDKNGIETSFAKVNDSANVVGALFSKTNSQTFITGIGG